MPANDIEAEFGVYLIGPSVLNYFQKLIISPVNYEKSRRVKRFFHTLPYLSLWFVVHTLFLLHSAETVSLTAVQLKQIGRFAGSYFHVWSSLLSPSVNHLNGIPYRIYCYQL